MEDVLALDVRVGTIVAAEVLRGARRPAFALKVDFGALGVRSAFLFIQSNAAILEQLAKMVDSGKLRPVVGAEFALKDIAKAHALSQSRHAVGKIALYVGQP